jgi:hypothetical protein
VRRLPPGLLLLLACLLVPSTGAARRAAPASIAISASPALYPAFSPGVTDYVTRCRGTRGVRLLVDTHGAASVTVAGRSRGGRFRLVQHVTPGRAFTFAAALAGSTRSYHVRCLPPKFPQWTFRRFRDSPEHLSLLAPGLALGKPTRPYVAIFDGHGVPVWWYAAPPAVVDAELLPGGLLGLARFEGGTFGIDPEAGYEVRRLDGRLVRTVRAVGSPTDDHELQPGPNGEEVVLSYVPRAGVDLTSLGGPASATVVDAEIQILGRRGGIVWRWNSKDHVALSESAGWPLTPARLADGRSAFDIVHANSVQIAGKTVVLSLRHTSAVYGIDRGTGRILWKLGGTSTPESLRVVGDGAGPALSGQHFARLQSDGTLTLHDNGTNAGRPPRALRFRLDLAAHTATLLESVSDPAVAASPCCGSAWRFADGRWLISWGGASVVGEYARCGAPLWKLSFGDDLFSYRATPVGPGVVSVAKLRAVMDAMNPRRSFSGRAPG